MPPVRLFARYPFSAISLAATILTDCLLYTSDAADEEDSGDLGGRRIHKKKKIKTYWQLQNHWKRKVEREEGDKEQ